MFKLIVAADLNGAIGKDNKLPWHIPEDLGHFKNMTMGKTVIMGRKTFESLPPHFTSGLPGRRNLVISQSLEASSSDNLIFRKSIESAKFNCSSITNWVIGGASIYEAFYPDITEIHLTRVYTRVRCPDSFIRLPTHKEWIESTGSPIKTSKSINPDTGEPYLYQFLVYKKRY